MILSEKFKLMILPNSSNKISDTDTKTWLGESKDIDAKQTIHLLKKNNINKIDLLVIDHYGIDYEWENHLSKLTNKIFVIDDLANRRHSCDFLLDQNFAPNSSNRYKKLVPDNCELFLGMPFFILNEDFMNLRKTIKPRKKLNNLLIFFGGIDKYNCTGRLLNSLKDKISTFGNIDVVVGKFNPSKFLIEKECKKYQNCNYHEQVTNMANLMSRADLCIGAGGSSNGERIFLGLPSIVFSVANNQLEVSKYLNELGLIYYAGSYKNISKTSIDKALGYFEAHHESILKNSKNLLSFGESKMDIMVKKLIQ